MFLNRADRRGHTPCLVCRLLLARPERTPAWSEGALVEATWAGATKSTPTVARRRVVSPFAGLGEIAATDPSTEIDRSSAIAAACSNSTGGMSPRELCSRSWLNHATHLTVASSSCACERQTRSEISSVL